MPMYMMRPTLQRLQQRIKDIQREKYDVARELQAAASFGDFSENAEYDAAKEKKEMLAIEEKRIQDWLGDAQLIEELKLPDDMVTIGKKLQVQDLDTGENFTYAIVGELDQWTDGSSLSHTSPLAAGLLNKKLGRSVEVRLPRQTRRFKILALENLFDASRT